MFFALALPSFLPLPYVQPVFRPPAEADSLILQVTVATAPTATVESATLAEASALLGVNITSVDELASARCRIAVLPVAGRCCLV